jgi:glucose/arabinose dehydrogenase
MRRIAAVPVAALALLAACGAKSQTGAGTATTRSAPAPAKTEAGGPPAAGQAASISTVATGLHVPWGVVFLPNGDALVSERTTGRIVRIPRGGGRPRRVMTLPGVDTNAGEGGLLGLALSPRYASDHLVYAYYTSPSDNRIVRFTLGGRPSPILTGLRRGVLHDGGGLAFGPDGKLYAGVGETGDSSLAQDRSSQNGKILRMNPDGSVPADNPFRGSRVWSYGHRNVQGLAWDRSGRLWATEFGQDRVDEVNIIRKGRDYGWPLVEGRGSTRGGQLTNPVVTWSPTSTSSPSGDAIAGTTLYVAGLRCECLFRIPLHGATPGRPTKLLSGRFGRLRTVVRAPDGALWVTTSNRDGRGVPRTGDDRILRLAVG